MLGNNFNKEMFGNMYTNEESGNILLHNNVGESGTICTFVSESDRCDVFPLKSEEVSGNMYTQ